MGEAGTILGFPGSYGAVVAEYDLWYFELQNRVASYVCLTEYFYQLWTFLYDFPILR